MKKTILIIATLCAAYLGLSAAGASSASGAASNLMSKAQQVPAQVMAAVRSGPAGIYQSARAAMERLGNGVKGETGL